MSNYNKLISIVSNYRGDMTNRIPIDINKFILDKDIIAKKLINIQNPSLAKEDIDIIIDGFPKVNLFEDIGELGDMGQDLTELANGNILNLDLPEFIPSVDIKIPEALNTIEGIVDNGDTEFKREVIKDRLKKDIKKGIGYPIDKKNSPIYKEVEELKSKLIKLLEAFFERAKQLFLDIKMAIISVSQSIPASLGLLITSFNLPAMILTITNTILVITQLKNACRSLKELVLEMEIVNLVLNREGKEKVSAAIVAINTTIDSTVCLFLDGIDKFISDALGFLKSNSSERRKARLVRIITKKLRKMKYLPNNNFTKVDEDDRDEVEDILLEWIVIRKDDKKAAVRSKNESNTNDAINNLNNLGNINDEFRKLLTDSQGVRDDVILYDIQFEDGTKLFGLTIDEIEVYKSNFKLVYL